MQEVIKRYNLVLLPSAAIRMEENCEFLSRVSEVAAVKLRHTFLRDIQKLQYFPNACPVHRKTKSNLYRRKLSGGRYRIIFHVSGDTVFVDDIQDCRKKI